MADDNEFIAAGLSHYGEVLRTIEHFRERVTNRAKQTLVSHPRIDSFRIEAGATPQAGWSGVAASEPWISAYIKGRLPHGEETSLDLGIWWNRPGEAPCIAYAGFAKCEWAQTLEPRAGSAVRVVGKYRNFALPQTDGELEVTWTKLLDELLHSVAASARANGR